MSLHRLLFSASVALAVSTPALSAETAAPAEGLSVTTTPPGFFETPSRYVSLSLKSEIYGPSLTEAGNISRPNLASGAQFNPKDHIRSENKLVAAYKVTPSVSAGVGLESNYVASEGHVLRDPYLVMRDSAVVRSGPYALDAQLRAYAGLTDSSVAARTPVAFRLAQTSSWRQPGSRLSFTVDAYVQAWVYGSGAANNARNARVHLLPQVNYRLAPTLNAQVAYKAWALHRRGHALTDFESEPTAAGPGLSWDATPSVNVNPYLDFSPGTGFVMRHTTVGMNLSWRAI